MNKTEDDCTYLFINVWSVRLLECFSVLPSSLLVYVKYTYNKAPFIVNVFSVDASFEWLDMSLCVSFSGI